MSKIDQKVKNGCTGAFLIRLEVKRGGDLSGHQVLPSKHFNRINKLKTIFNSRGTNAIVSDLLLLLPPLSLESSYIETRKQEDEEDRELCI